MLERVIEKNKMKIANKIIREGEWEEETTDKRERRLVKRRLLKLKKIVRIENRRSKHRGKYLSSF